MKPFDKLTHEELINLTHEQIEKYIALRCAERGIPLLPTVPKMPEKPDTAPDIVVYEVGPFAVLDIETAIRIADFFKGIQLYDITYVSGPRYEKKAVPTEMKFEVSPRQVYSEEYWNSIKGLAEAHETMVKEYNEAKEYYSDIYAQRREVREEIYSVVNEALNREAVKQDVIHKFNTYVELADGNRAIACNFFRNAYPELAQQYSELVSELTTSEPECGD